MKTSSLVFDHENSFLSSVIELSILGFSSKWSVLNQERGVNENWEKLRIEKSRSQSVRVGRIRKT